MSRLSRGAITALGMAALVWAHASALHGATALGSQVGQKMPDFSLSNQDGKDTEFYRLVKGKKALVYYFMGCCGHCVTLLPKMSELAQEARAHQIAVVGIQYYGNSQMCKFSMDKHKIVGTVLADSRGEICRRMGVGEFTTMTLDPDGVIRFRGPDINNIDQIKKSLEL
jgi:peroxiredoxin